MIHYLVLILDYINYYQLTPEPPPPELPPPKLDDELLLDEEKDDEELEEDEVYLTFIGRITFFLF